MSRPLAGALRVARRELRAYLVVPWTYGVAVAFLALTGVIFYVVADGAREASLRFWFPNLAFVLLVTAPIVTSRLLSEEWRSRHLDILLARPISPGGLVVGKWLAAVALFVLLLVPSAVYVAYLAAWGDPDWPPMVASYLGAILLIGLFCAVGTMASALTPTAVAAGLGSFTVLVVAQLANGVAAVRGLSFQPHLEGFARGAPGADDGLYFISFTAAALVVASGWQAVRRTVAGRLRTLAVPAVALVAAAAVNLVPVPATARVDFTATGRFTLAGQTKEVLRNVDQPARVTAFAPEGSGEARDAEVLLDEIERVNGKIDGRVLDFTKFGGEASRLGITDDGEVAVEVGERKEVVAPLVEGLVASALQRLARGKPQTVCSLVGHGEKELDAQEPDGFSLALALMDRNGIEARRLDLTVAPAIPPECTMVALLGPRAELLPNEVTVLDGFLRAQGRMLILREPDGPELDALTSPWGMRLLPGLTVDPERSEAGDPTTLVVNSFPTAHPVTKSVDAVLMRTASGIARVEVEDEGLSVAKLLESSGPSWLELTPGIAAYEPDQGDRGGPVVLGGAADRSEVQPGGETRVSGGGPSIARTRLLVYADAQWATNAVIGQLANSRLFANGLNWLAGEEDLVAIPGVDPDLRRLTLTRGRRQQMAVGAVGVVPGLALVAGGLVWLRRRRR
ncbi:MAG: Gldg family protein [Acidimicrobiia bacterium]